jgi:adenosylcobinamide kinase/adenosylcobinamide-phosphate guanylyltransferase
MKCDRSSSSKIILITGAASSGKSEWAETLAIKTEKLITYIATAQVNSNDPEWLAKIKRHQQRRPSTWQIIEAPFALKDKLELASAERCLLIDSLGTWVANLLSEDEDSWQKTSKNFVDSLRVTVGYIILVAEETGWGVVPAYEAGRLFRDRLGQLIREIGTIADRVYLVTGGHALDLKKLGNSVNDSSFKIL